jgi:signal transduction histidine kinase
VRTPIRFRLSITIFAVLLVGMGLVAVLTWIAVEQLYINTQRENLLAQAQLAADAMDGTSLPITSAKPYSQTTNVLPGIHSRFLGDQGAVLVNLPITANDEAVQVPLAENTSSIPADSLLQRPEIQSALGGTAAARVRRVASVENRRVLYAAAPVFSQDGTISGIIYLATPLPPARLPTHITLQLAGAVFFAGLLAGGVGMILSRRISRPLERLVQAASLVASGDLEHQVPVDSDIKELHSLGENFNDMTANLRQSDLAKNAFIADVTHELRTPLTVINGTIETLEDGAIDDLTGRGQLLISMAAETKRLIRLVNDLLVLTRADAGTLNLKLENVNVGELVKSRCEKLTTLAQPRNVAISVDAWNQVSIQGDVDRLTQILDNLLENAIRHAPAGSTIRVVVQIEGHEMRCAVIDQGAGIPAQHLPLIFDRFYRVEPSRNRQSGGAGLGLAIVQSLVNAHGGRIAAESLEGQGTTMTFWIPIDGKSHSFA